MSVDDNHDASRGGAWNWPGSRWWRCDLHVHTPCSHDYTKGAAVTSSEIVHAAVAAGLDAIAVTDHNAAAMFEELEDAAAQSQPRLVVFPGTEITSSEGAHLLVVFPPGSPADVIKGYLGNCGVPGETWGKSEALASENYVECITRAEELGALCIAAHADRPATSGKKETSLLRVISAGQPLMHVLAMPELHAAEICSADADAHRQLRALDTVTRLPLRPCVSGSDAHEPHHLGRASTWIKMSYPDQDGLRLAFADGDMSVLVATAGENDPNAHAALAIESIEIGDGKLIGRGSPFTLALNPWLNAIIGGRGTGKSSVVEFLRLALQREDELPPGLRGTFNEFARVPANRNDRGLLTELTHVTVVYRKDGSRFRVQWRHDGSATAIEEEIADTWTAAEGAVTERFPARIYSQKQIFELAEGPESLLKVIDESPQVSRAGWDELWRTGESEFLALRAQARQLEGQLAEEGRLRGHLDDINKRLEVFESSNHRDVLQAYRLRQDQTRAVEQWEADLRRVADELRAAVTATTVTIDFAAFGTDDEADASLLAAVAEEKTRVDEVRNQVEAAANAVEAIAEGWPERKRALVWTRAADEAATSYTSLLERLKAEGVGSPDEYADLVREREEVTGRLDELRQMRESLADLAREAAEALEHLHELRRQLTERRRTFLAQVLATNEHVRINVIPYGDRSTAEQTFRELIGREGGFQNDISSPEDTGLIPRLYANFESGDGPAFEKKLATLREGVTECAYGGTPNWLRDRRFGEYLRGLAPETIDRLAYWSPEDTVDVFYSRTGDGQNFQTIRQGSPGQKTAAILAFLLAYGDEPIILDQPEDDLDSTLIYGLIVRQLRANKHRRQIIVVTHDANIVVNGDAEYVAALDFDHGQTRISEHGGLQERALREAVCEIMEGGRSAFEQRYQRIGRHL